MSFQPRSDRRAFTLIELLVVIAIIATLVAILLPAVQQAREAARRSTCKNNLKQLGIAFHNYHDTFGVFPYASTFIDATAPAGMKQSDLDNLRYNHNGWFRNLLPYLELGNLYDSLDKNNHDFATTARAPSTIINFDQIKGKFFSVVTCPSNPFAGTGVMVNNNGFIDTNGEPFQEAMYRPSGGPMNTGVAGDCGAAVNLFCRLAVFQGTNTGDTINGGFSWTIRNEGEVKGMFARGVTSFSMPQDVQDGTSNTIMMGEAKPHYNNYGSIWTWNIPMNAFYLKPNSLLLRNLEVNNTVGWQNANGYASYHKGGVQFLFVDGRVEFISENIDYQTYCKLGNRIDGAPVGEY